MNIQDLIFYFFAALLLFSGIMVIMSRNPVQGVLFLVLAFFASSVLWILLQAEFLGLVLIFVYVGAVMTLFLFVVMMLNIDMASMRQNLLRYLPLGILIIAALLGLVLLVISPEHFAIQNYTNAIQVAANHSNTRELGSLLYTHYVYAFEIAAVLLLVAIIAAISLTIRGPRGVKTQRIKDQIAVNPKDRVRLMTMQAEK